MMHGKGMTLTHDDEIGDLLMYYKAAETGERLV